MNEPGTLTGTSNTFSFNSYKICGGSSLLHGRFSGCGNRELLSSCSERSSHCRGLSWGAWALGAQASVLRAQGISSCSSQAVEHRLSGFGAWALLLHGDRKSVV